MLCKRVGDTQKVPVLLSGIKIFFSPIVGWINRCETCSYGGLTIINNTKHSPLKSTKYGNSLAVQWWGLSTFTAGAWVQSLVGEIGPHKPSGTAKKKKLASQDYNTIDSF